MYASVETLVGRLSRATALIGGISLLCVVGLTCLSVAGRGLDMLGLGPIPGDIELVELGIGFAVFSAMPYAQFARTHAKVDVLTRFFSVAGNRVLDLLGELALFAIFALISWRLWLGMIDKGAYGETTFILQIPVVWGYRAAMLTCVVGVIVALFCVWRAGRVLFAPTDEMSHP